jgi:hypothetical protein
VFGLQVLFGPDHVLMLCDAKRGLSECFRNDIGPQFVVPRNFFRVDPTKALSYK